MGKRVLVLNVSFFLKQATKYGVPRWSLQKLGSQQMISPCSKAISAERRLKFCKGTMSIMLKIPMKIGARCSYFMSLVQRLLCHQEDMRVHGGVILRRNQDQPPMQSYRS
jgi:hypothetical protein